MALQLGKRLQDFHQVRRLPTFPDQFEADPACKRITVKCGPQHTYPCAPPPPSQLLSLHILRGMSANHELAAGPPHPVGGDLRRGVMGVHRDVQLHREPIATVHEEKHGAPFLHPGEVATSGLSIDLGIKGTAHKLPRGREGEDEEIAHAEDEVIGGQGIALEFHRSGYSPCHTSGAK